MPNTKTAKRKSTETEQDKRLREVKKQKLEEDLQHAQNQEQALDILRELLFLTNDKQYSDMMHNKYGFEAPIIDFEESEPEQCCSKTLTTQKDENIEEHIRNKVQSLNDKIEESLKEIDNLKKTYIKENETFENIIEISDEDEDLAESCCDNITKSEKCITHEMDNSVSTSLTY